MTRSLVWVALASSSVGCAAPAPRPKVAEIPPARLQLYSRALPAAVRFVSRAIPATFIPPEDRGNDTYLEAYGPTELLVGYLREFSGPMSLAEGCPCSPLSVTLAFDSAGNFTAIVAASPLEKRNRLLMADEDLKRLTILARTPPPELLALSRIEDTVDAVTAATRSELKKAVVPDAAFTSYRVVRLVENTRRILKEAPRLRDAEELERVLALTNDPAGRAQNLARFVAEAETVGMREHAYQLMAKEYASALGRRAGTDEFVNSVLLGPPDLGSQRATAIASACNTLASQGLEPALLWRCLAVVETAQPAADKAVFSLLRGTVLFLDNKRDKALPDLLTAASTYSLEQDPALHLRLVEALSAARRVDEACPRARALYGWAPLLPGAKATLVACRPAGGSVEPVAKEIDEAQRKVVLASRLGGSAVAPELPVEDAAQRSLDLRLGAPGQVTVLVVFSTWCPHCQVELPRIVDFAKSLEESSALRATVRLLGLRTAVERETESYDAFAARLGINFPVYTDASFSLAYSLLARSLGIPATLPVVFVVDPQGVVRFVLHHTPYQDTATRLRWMIEAR